MFMQTQLSFLDPLPVRHTYLKFSHENTCSDDERIRLENRYSKLFVEDSRFNRQVVSFQASKGAILHSWIKYREGFSAFLVDTLLQEFNVQPGEKILEPFAGNSTTLLVCKMRGINADGIEILPNCHLSWDAKSRYSNYDIQELLGILNIIENSQPISTGQKFPHIIITEGAFSEQTEAELMFFVELFEKLDISTDARILVRLVLMSVLESISYTRKDGQYLRWDYRSSKVIERNSNRQAQGKKFIKKIDKGELPSAKEALTHVFRTVIDDIKHLQIVPINGESKQVLLNGSTLEILPNMPDNSYSAVITSPPYANRYDYTRTYALELAYLGIGDGIFDLRQRLLSCTVESRSKIAQLRKYYQSIGEINRFEHILKIVQNNKVLQEINRALQTRWDKGDMNNKGVLPMIDQYLTELAFVFGEIYRISKCGAHVAFVNDNVRYGGEIIPIDTITTNLAEELGFIPEKIYVLAQKKGNSSQQMEKFGREELRKCITIWRKE